jgi:hypothetical protein
MTRRDDLLTMTMTREQWWEVAHSMVSAGMEFGESQASSDIIDAIHRLLGERYEDYLRATKDEPDAWA